MATVEHSTGMAAPIIAFLSDFGTTDWYVAAVKGVLLRIIPEARVVDISHEVPPGDVRAGALVLANARESFPAGTVFLAVVDPGVGTRRKPVALRADGCLYVGPDNGLFAPLLRPHAPDDFAAHELTNAYLFREMVTHTFHGRDLFGPVAGHLAAGSPLEKCGPGLEAAELHGLPWPEPRNLPHEHGVEGEVVYIDHFGNAITNLSKAELGDAHDPAHLSVSLKPEHVPMGNTFGDVPKGSPVAYFGSTGALEIAVNGGRADHVLSLEVGNKVDLLWQRQ